MSRIVFCLLVVVAVLSTAWGGMPPKKCRKNEVLTGCVPTCPLKCHPPLKPQVCPRICVAGCKCKNGYLRNSRNKCVRPCNCDC